jgi:hypothetical protein
MAKMCWPMVARIRALISEVRGQDLLAVFQRRDDSTIPDTISANASA